MTKGRAVQFLRFWLSFWTIFGLSHCGNGGDASSALHVRLKIPSSYSSAAFWVGVESKTLLAESESGEQKARISWSDRKKVDLREGDKLRFEGRDALGELLVAGEAKVGKEDTLWIPVERVL